MQGSFDDERHLIEISDISGYILRPYLCYIALCISQSSSFVIKGPQCSPDDIVFAKHQITSHLFIRRLINAN